MSAVSDDSKSKAFISDLEECLAYVQKRQKKSKWVEITYSIYNNQSDVKHAYQHDGDE